VYNSNAILQHDESKSDGFHQSTAYYICLLSSKVGPIPKSNAKQSKNALETRMMGGGYNNSHSVDNITGVDKGSNVLYSLLEGECPSVSLPLLKTNLSVVPTGRLKAFWLTSKSTVQYNRSFAISLSQTCKVMMCGWQGKS
jgi:hypothetical protein